MKNLINNFIYGQTTPLLLGNPLNEISNQGCSVLKNMATMLQGGIRRRPPLKHKYTFTDNPVKLIEFTIDVTNSFVVAFSTTGITILDWNDNTVSAYPYPTGFGVATESDIKEFESATYYNSVYIVQKNHPLLKILFTGSAGSQKFAISLPTIYCNQDNKPEDVNVGYGQNDFNDFYLNKSAGNYASKIAIMEERMWLASTINDPYTLWVSRPYGTTQKLEPATANDSILDFTQYQIVTTDTQSIDETLFPVSIQKYSDGNIIYAGISTAQVMWKKPAYVIETKSQLEAWENFNSLVVEMRTETGHIAEIRNVYQKVNGVNQLYIYLDDSVYRYTETGTKSQSDPEVTANYIQGGELVGSFTLNGEEIAVAKPKYSIDLTGDTDVFTTSTVKDLVATESTGIETQLASGRNDKITWINLGYYILVGTENGEWTLDSNINPLDGNANSYSSYGSIKGLNCKLGTDNIFIARGNKLKLLYKDYYGLQKIDLSITCPELMEGELSEIKAKNTGNSAVYILKDNGNITCVTIDRENSIQAFSEWDFASGRVESLCIAETRLKQVLVALVKETVDDTEVSYLEYFDEDETVNYKDCYQGVNNSKNYNSQMSSNTFDSQTDDGSTTIGYKKLVDNVVFRAYNTGKVYTYTDERNINLTRDAIARDSVGDFRMNVNGINSTELVVTIKSYEGEPMNILALAYNVKVGK